MPFMVITLISLNSRSREGARIEINPSLSILSSLLCRSREGARIEILLILLLEDQYLVAPVRERGLKLSKKLN